MVDSVAHIAGIVEIDQVPVSRNIIVIKDDPSAWEVVGFGMSEVDGTFDIAYSNWGGTVIALAIDKYGDAFHASVPLSVGAVIHPTVPNGYVYYVTVSGTTGTAEPAWAIDGSVVSGSVTFNPQPYYRPIASGPIQGERIYLSDPYLGYVTALVHFDGVNGATTATEETGNASIVLNSGAAITTTASRFGLGSLNCNGAGSYATLTGSNLALGTGNFTIELYANRQGWGDYSDGEIFLIDARLGGTSAFLLDINNKTDRRLRWYVGGTARISAVDVIGPTWVAIAVCRVGTTTTLYIDGVAVGAWTNDTTNYISAQWVIGGRYALLSGSRLSWDGFIDEFRVTKGIARYTGNYTPSPYPFPSQ